MALIPRKALCETSSLLLQFRRFRGKINIQRPRKPHFERAKYIALTQPYFINPNKDKTPQELCKGFKEQRSEETENPFQRILSQELYKWLTSSRLIVFYHSNPMPAELRFKAKVSFKKKNMHLTQYGKKTVEMAVKGTPYEAVLNLFVSHNVMLFSPEPDIKTVFSISKKFPQFVLLAGVLEGKFVSRDELTAYSLIRTSNQPRPGSYKPLTASVAKSLAV
ncbi:hypothetical protein NQ318_020126 [Aromia moschata]|uniref:Large ribosomal subunit protein uL10m n=1 Tax=Aromia moschata TaxID=1265417 RepID=A0AAV8ZB58_9CUCU|nr:hypothetical protein NQ318_020126 [Aromia moschata]